MKLEFNDMKMKEHLRYLIEQFKQSTGINSDIINMQAFMSEFMEWLKEREEISNTYVDLLDYMGLSYFATSSTIEVGKSSVDSIVMPYDTLIITPYSKFLRELNTKDNQRVIDAEFKVVNGMAFQIFKDNENVLVPIKNMDDLTFMTQNPYTFRDIKNWEQLHNSFKRDIIVGIYGNIHDKDTEAKIKLLKQFKNRLCVPFDEEYVISSDRYCYVIASNRKNRKLVLTKNN